MPTTHKEFLQTDIKSFETELTHPFAKDIQIAKSTWKEAQCHLSLGKLKNQNHFSPLAWLQKRGKKIKWWAYGKTSILIYCWWKKVKVKSLSRVWLFATPWTVAYQAPQSMEFSRQEYWSGLPFPSPGYLPKPGIELWSPALQTDSLPIDLFIT